MHNMDNLRFGTLLVDPDRFFGELRTTQCGLIIPAVIVGVIGMANIVTTVLTGTIGYNPSLKSLFFSESPALVFALPYVIWILASGILAGIATRLSGIGGFCVTLRNAGYAVLPMAGFSLAFHAALLTVMPSLVSHFQEGMLFFMIMLMAFMACLLWTGYLLVYAAKHALSLEPARALNAVVVTFLIAALAAAGTEFAVLWFHGMTSSGMP